MAARPLVFDLFAGLGGWADGFLAEGYDVIGFDIERRPYPGRLVLQDVTTIHGSQFRDAAVIVASPPCQEFSYMAMPWKRAKQIARALRGQDEFPEGYTGSRTIEQLTALFDACFRIQREASEAAGRYIPLVVENVKGAQPWVGRARARYGPFYLWGDVPAILPAGKLRKQEGDPSWFYDNYENSARRFSSHSKERKQWSAQIAKIPLELSQWVAQCFKPISSPVRSQAKDTLALQALPFKDDGQSIDIALDPSPACRPSIEQSPSTDRSNLPSSPYAAVELGRISALSNRHLLSSTVRLRRTDTTSATAETGGLDTVRRENQSSAAQPSIVASLAILIQEPLRQPTIAVAPNRQITALRSLPQRLACRGRSKPDNGLPRRNGGFRVTAGPVILPPSSPRIKCAKRAAAWRPANLSGLLLDPSASITTQSGRSLTELSGSPLVNSQSHSARAYKPAQEKSA